LISKATKESVLQTILNSDEFSGSKNSRKLLSYLTNASITGKSPTETTIALELFGRDKNFNPNDDSIIRVYVHNLRKKLENYYRNEGINDKIGIEIPKGHYEARFVQISPKPNKIPPHKYNISLIILCAIACIQIFLFLWLWKEKTAITTHNVNIKPQGNFPQLFWADSLKNDLSFLIVIGDHFFFQEYQINLHKWQLIRDFNINSISDFDQFRIQNPKIKLKIFNDSYFPTSYISELMRLSNIIYSISDNKIHYCCASNLQTYNLEEQNIVFYGTINTLGTLNRFFSDSLITIEDLNNSVTLPSITEETSKTFSALSEPGGKNKDYAVIKKVQGANKNNILIITSFHQAGLINAVKFLRKEKTAKILKESFIEKFNKIPSDFVILLEVVGCEKNGYSVEIQKMYEIPPSINFLN